MGYLTTITIRNDALDAIESNQDDFIKKLLRHCRIGGREYRQSFSLGSHGNPVGVQIPRHADDRTIYVHAGNTLVEMNAYSIVTRETVTGNPKFFDDLVRFMEGELRELKALKAKMEREKDGNK